VSALKTNRDQRPPSLPPLPTGASPASRSTEIARIAGDGHSARRQSPSRITPEVLNKALAATIQAVQSGVQARRDAVQLTHTAFETARRQIDAMVPGASARDRADALVAVASTCLLSPDDVKKLALVDSGFTKVVSLMRAAPKVEDPRKPLLARDHTGGRGQLDPAFSDDSDLQARHIGFFMAAGYVAGGRPDQSLKTMIGALYHETLFDRQMRKHGGGSTEDYVASVFATLAGSQLRLLRNQGKGGLIPTVVAGFMARSADMVPRRLPPAQHTEAMKVILEMREMRKNLMPLVANPLATGMIGQDNAAMSGVVKHADWLMDLLVTRNLPR
jgi:hypothetical protein